MSDRIRAVRSPGAAGGDRRPRPGRRTEPAVRQATRELPCRRRGRGHSSA